VIEAIVMAAGEGRRLRPVTERWPKPVLPIDGRPVVATVLRALKAAGCERITVVTGYRADQVERLLGDGSAFGLELRYARQPKPDGSADAVSYGLAAGAEAPLLVATADTVFRQGDLARFAAAFAEAATPGAVAIRRDPPPGPGRARVDVEDGFATRISASGESPFAHASLWGLGPELTPYLTGLGGPPFELLEAYQHAIGDGLRVLAVEVGSTRDLTDPLDLMKENFVYLRPSE
jgi:NDP-sugar pyrophosphorylase family protein